MKRVVIVHGWGGGSNNDWLPWIKTELEKMSYEVLVPDMPETDAPTIKKWVGTLAEVVGTPNPETYFIGHSIGCQAILRYLEAIDTEVGGALFVAGWFNLENLEDAEASEIAKPWIETPINFEKIKEVLPKSILLISKDDPYGAFQENVDTFSQFVTHTSIFDHAGHFNGSQEPSILNQFGNLVHKD